MTLSLHPLCALFPRMAGAEFEALKDDIKTNGLRHPIITHKGMILDGRNRYEACMAVGAKPLMIEYTGTNLVTYVMSANFFRRHLSPGQQTAIVASAQDWATAQTVRKPKSGNVTGLQTVADRAAVSGASDKTQRMADKLAKESPELATKVAHGEISLPQAVEQIKPKTSGKPKKAHRKKAEPPAENTVMVTTPPPDDGPDSDELAANDMAMRADMDALQKLLNSDDKLATAHAEITRVNAELAVVKLARNGHMNKCNELIKTIKRLNAKVDKIEGSRATGKAKPALVVVAPVVPPEDEYTEMDAANDQIEALQSMLAVASMGNAPEQDKDMAKNLIAELRAENKTLRLTIKAITQSRNQFQDENAQLRSQIQRQRREIDRATGHKTA